MIENTPSSGEDKDRETIIGIKTYDFNDITQPVAPQAIPCGEYNFILLSHLQFPLAKLMGEHLAI